VATLVAKEAVPTEVFSRVAEEVARVLGDVETSLWRDEGDGTATVVAVHGDLAEVGTRLATDGTIAEALTNVLKHAEASHAEVTASATATALRIEVRDDGVGGADPHGNGMMGLQDRAAALGGSLTIESPAGGGTVLAVTLPFTAARGSAPLRG
jgi:signal transduction histidine kinase